MDRRQFLVGTGVGAVMASAGCLGYEITSTEEINDLENRIEELETQKADLEAQLDEIEATNEELNSQIESLEAEKEDLNDQIATLEASEEDLEEQIATLESEKEDIEAARVQLIEDRLTTLYEQADTYNGIAEDETSTASDTWDNEEWHWAARWYGMAFRTYDAIEYLTRQVVSLAEAEGYTDAADIASTSQSYADSIRWACDQWAIAAGNYAEGDDADGDQHLSNGDDYWDEAQNDSFIAFESFKASV